MSTNKGQLFIVGTPIGNLGDFSARGKEILGSVDLVLCEDTRVTSRLLAHFGITPSTMSFHEHTDPLKRQRIVEQLLEGKKIALVSDAGTPAISDPGGFLVADAVAAGITVTPIPGPSALITALSISGFPLDSFTFLGFPPHKKGRATFFKEVMNADRVQVFYESTHRIEKALESLAECAKPLVVCRELTKMHETIYRGTAVEVLKALQETSTKGEFVVIVGK
jgi:16S rRNA (cytidine1402-2'-O)-methyltransferase